MGNFRVSLGVFFVLIGSFFVSCEAVFTSNVFEFAQRDPSDMSKAQKIAYGQDALASGDAEAMGKAYDALKDTTDPNLQPFVAELALGAAGVTDAMANMMGDVAAGSTEEEIEAAMEKAVASFNSTDLTLISEAAALIQNAEASGSEVTADQYLVAGVGLLVVALDAAGGDASAIDVSTGAGATAIAFLTAASASLPEGSEAAKLLDDFKAYF